MTVLYPVPSPEGGGCDGFEWDPKCKMETQMESCDLFLASCLCILSSGPIVLLILPPLCTTSYQSGTLRGGRVVHKRRGRKEEREKFHSNKLYLRSGKFPFLQGETGALDEKRRRFKGHPLGVWERAFSLYPSLPLSCECGRIKCVAIE